jgi:hypothetical protein
VGIASSTTDKRKSNLSPNKAVKKITGEASTRLFGMGGGGGSTKMGSPSLMFASPSKYGPQQSYDDDVKNKIMQLKVITQTTNVKSAQKSRQSIMMMSSA